MNLCKVCFQKVEGGVVIPAWRSGEGDDDAFVHEECLIQRTLEFIKGISHFGFVPFKLPR